MKTETDFRFEWLIGLGIAYDRDAETLVIIVPFCLITIEFIKKKTP